MITFFGIVSDVPIPEVRAFFVKSSFEVEMEDGLINYSHKAR